MCDFNAVKIGDELENCWKELKVKREATSYELQDALERLTDQDIETLSYSASCIVWRLLNDEEE